MDFINERTCEPLAITDAQMLPNGQREASGGPTPDDQPEHPGQLRAALYAPLVLEPSTPSAKALEEALYELTTVYEASSAPRKRSRTGNAERAFRATMSAFLADLVLASAHEPSEGRCYRERVSTSFTETVASKRQFDHIISLWQQAGLIDVWGGFRLHDDWEGEATNTGQRWATRYRATPALLAIAARHGVTAETVKEHYTKNLSGKTPVSLRARKTGKGKKAKGRKMKVDREDTMVAAMAADVRVINSEIAKHAYSFGEPPYLERLFNNGDDRNFNWDQGGRLYARGADSYQQVKSGLRRQFTIDGTPTVELDFQASHLRLVYALASTRICMNDLYEIAGLPRMVTKGLIAAHLGNGQAPKRWPEGLVADYVEAYGRKPSKDFKLKDAVAAVLKANPILEEIEIDTLRLQYVESEIMIKAMLSLIRDHVVVSLPMHDCLIVKEEDQHLCREAMRRAYFDEVGEEPVIVEKGR